MNIKEVDEFTQDSARQIVLEGLGEHFGYIDEHINTDLEDICANYTQKGDKFFVGLIEEKVVATGALMKEEKGIGRIIRMSVSKEQRRKGLASQMLKYIIDSAKKEGYTGLVLSTEHNWHAAIKLYEKFGFQKYSVTEIDLNFSMDL